MPSIQPQERQGLVTLGDLADITLLDSFSHCSMLLQVNTTCPGLTLIPIPNLYGPPELSISPGTSISSKAHILLWSQILNPSLLKGRQDDFLSRDLRSIRP